ncbi:hypothetical protein AVEN_2408-1 [Araneus ventricosus]|uniref:Uncharacterized protein n=1 Tax=Araneus ventricosus TaxID=182803 RepID=A0A4Y2Q7G4_ARAVE|nr:hypothetical protein AVEN_2408-1 [Araneus ventricosus]
MASFHNLEGINTYRVKEWSWPAFPLSSLQESSQGWRSWNARQYCKINLLRDIDSAQNQLLNCPPSHSFSKTNFLRVRVFHFVEYEWRKCRKVFITYQVDKQCSLCRAGCQWFHGALTRKVMRLVIFDRI